MRSHCCHIVMSQIHDYDHITMRLSQNDAHHVMSLWCLYDIEIMTSHVWVVCEVTVTRVDHITMRSWRCHSMMSQIHKMTTSPWGHSVVTGWCSHCDVQLTSLWYHYYVIIRVSYVWCHCDTGVISRVDWLLLLHHDVGNENEMNRAIGHLCAHIGWTGPGEPPEDGEMIEMTLSFRHRIRNSSPGGLRPSTLPLGHGGSPQYWLSHVDGEETFSNRRDREPNPELWRERQRC